MKVQEKGVTYQSQNSYATLNTLSESTEYIWLIFHGIGFLSRYFLKYFTGFPKSKHYFIAPQAPSKYYLNSEYKHVGASWLTRENTEVEKENVMAYLDAVWASEVIPKRCKLIILGYSQGVSIATRFLAYKKISPYQIMLYAGGLPEELQEEDFRYLSRDTPITFVYGRWDPYLNPDRLIREQDKLEGLFAGRAIQHPFEGGHEFKKELIHNLLL